MRLIQAYNQAKTKSSVKVKCRAEQLFTGLECGIGGFLRVVQEVGPETDEWELDMAFLVVSLSLVLRSWKSWRPILQCTKWISTAHLTLLLLNWVALDHDII